MSRRKIVMGNWKMNMSPAEAVQLINMLKVGIDTDEVDVVLCVPYVDIPDVAKCLKGTKVKLGAQNMHYDNSGAFTGEISAPMLKELGVEYVILGHSERRAYFNETDDAVNKKIAKALEFGITPIVCCGETLSERIREVTMEKVKMQIKSDLRGIEDNAVAEKVVLAYEPIWAIGTGKVATPEHAENVCACIRATIAEMYDDATAAAVRIVYGGSVNGGNAEALFGMGNIDGALVGGASLKPGFEDIVKAGVKKSPKTRSTKKTTKTEPKKTTKSAAEKASKPSAEAGSEK